MFMFVCFVFLQNMVLCFQPLPFLGNGSSGEGLSYLERGGGGGGGGGYPVGEVKSNVLL